MAEVAPLSSARAHARKAAQERHDHHEGQAAVEYENAAADFARASKATSNPEALRILHLLEEQHQRLARILRSPNETNPSPLSHESKESSGPNATKKDSLQSKTLSYKPDNSRSKPTSSAIAAAKVGSQVRDSSPSLTRELASRRGIPQSGRGLSSPTAQARARQLSPESQRRNPSSATAPKVPPSVVSSQANLNHQRKTSERNEDDEAFSRFYSQITTGTMSKLSAALAYAGLPLTADDAVKASEGTSSSSRNKDLAASTVHANNDPDVKKIFSKAALNAIEEEHRQRGTLGHGVGPAESFYVVPPYAGTKSYSHVVRGNPYDAAGGLGEDDEDAFVDAREAQGPPSPKHSRAGSGAKRGGFGKGPTSEELELENTTLKQTLEGLANRLAAFEAHAQDAALTQSMIGMHPPAGNGAGGAGATDATMLKRLRQLEQQAAKDAEERHRLEAQATKQAKSIETWEQRYQSLRKGAKKRMMEAKEKAQPGDEEDGLLANEGMPGAA
ncbi:hypothetical protein KC340_g5056 [Hortaea werneckii]|nr:hypothetical protein KC339_g7181 [Hortaea werneckii]KAI7242642.1 hypothetical protein KC365_g2986 [Hortaea werneckii]KAI7328553.1 hypothetical protein KC340_g5056 [Hortaea werneckii]KAI7396753.1 hypothetical protein KC328_g5206 [Hortaea werneckii]